jgi:hypothetical protein
MLRCSLIGRLVIVLGVGVLAALVPTGASGQELGQLYVEVLDAAGLPIADLTPADFTVTENGMPATVVSAELDDTPMRIALMADNGAIIQEMNGINAVRGGLNAFLETLPLQHEISLFSIGRNIRRRVDFTADRDELKDGVVSIDATPRSNTILLDGLKETWEEQFEDDVTFPVFVLLLTDGEEGSRSYNDEEFNELIDMLINNGVTVHTVMLTRGRYQRCSRCTSSYAPSLTQYGGGIYEEISRPVEFSQTLTTIATRMGEHFDQISNRYRVIYERSAPPGAQISLQIGRSGANMLLFANRRMPQ